MKPQQCIFCQIANKEIPSPILYEDEHVVAILDKFPSSLGHLLVITKSHYRNIYEIDDQTASQIFPAVAKLSRAIKQITRCEGINILQNNGSAAGQTVSHIHIHIIPRYDNDEVGIVWEKIEPDEDDVAKFAEKVKAIIKSEQEASDDL